MAQGLNYAKTIRHLLVSGKVIENVDNIYPLINPSESVTYPYVVYSMTGLAPEYTKDGATSDTVNFQVVICDNDYDRMVTASGNVRNALELHKYTTEDSNIRNCKITGCEEQYDDTFQCFARRILFSCNVD